MTPPGDKDVWQFTKPSELRHSAFGEAVMIGTPDQVARKMERFTDEFQCTHFIMSTQLAGMDPRKSTRSLGAVCQGGHAGVSGLGEDQNYGPGTGIKSFAQEH